MVKVMVMVVVMYCKTGCNTLPLIYVDISGRVEEFVGGR